MNYPVSPPSTGHKSYTFILRLFFFVIIFSAIAFGGYKVVLYSTASAKDTPVGKDTLSTENNAAAPPIADWVKYQAMMKHIVNTDKSCKWPVKTEYPREGALPPDKRIV